MSEIDPATKKVKTKVINDKTEKVPRTSDSPGNPADDPTVGAMPQEELSGGDEKNPTSTAGYQPHPGDPDDKSFLEQAKGMFGNQTLAMGFPLEVETIGVPTLRPKQLVKVAGLGIRLDTVEAYMVQKVVHTLNASGFTTNLTMIANGGTLLPTQQAFKVEGSTNPGEDPEGSEVKAEAQNVPPG